MNQPNQPDSPSPEEIVDFVLAAMKQKTSDVDICSQLEQMGVPRDEAEFIQLVIASACLRAGSRGAEFSHAWDTPEFRNVGTRNTEIEYIHLGPYYQAAFRRTEKEVVAKRWDELAQKLDRLHEADPELAYHGAAHHRYALQPPAPVEDVEAFEREYRVELPADYRSFLLRMGNGGMGPGHGILSLKESVTRLQLLCESAEASSSEILSAPFKRPKSEEDAAASDAFPSGLLPICDWRFGLTVCLVVAGQDQGTLWIRTDDGVLLPFPNPDLEHRLLLFPAGAEIIQSDPELYRKILAGYDFFHLGFLEWYQEWVERTLRDDQFKADTVEPKHYAREKTRWNPSPPDLRKAERTGLIIGCLLVLAWLIWKWFTRP